MANRFIDTGFYKSPFVRGLQGSLKGLYCFIICDCNGSGIWVKDLPIASEYIGHKVTDAEFEKHFVKTGKAIDLGNGKFFFPDFVQHQYPKGLSYKNIAHNNFILELKKYGLIGEDLKPLQRVVQDPISNGNSKGNGNGQGDGNCNYQLKEIFCNFYFEKTTTEYIWSEKDWGKTKTIKSKLLIKIKEKNPGLDKSKEDETIVEGFSHLLKGIKDTWILSNLSMSIIDTKFNEIVNQIINKTNGKQSTTERGKSELAKVLANIAAE